MKMPVGSESKNKQIRNREPFFKANQLYRAHVGYSGDSFFAQSWPNEIKMRWVLLSVGDGSSTVHHKLLLVYIPYDFVEVFT